MNMRSCRILLLAAMGALVSFAQNVIPGRIGGIQDRSFPVRPVLLSTGDPPELIEFEQWISPFYSRIRFERSLLISDCGEGSSWCGREEFGFQEVFKKAARISGSSGDAAASAWYRYATRNPSLQFNKAVQPWTGAHLKGAPFQTLAVVNRMDQAQWDAKASRWTGVEVRFVYGVIPPESAITIDGWNLFTIILEFTLEPLDWRHFEKLAGKWLALSETPRDAFVDKLREALDDSHLDKSPLVRMRMNRSVGGTRWALSQYEFTAKKFAPAPLTDQIAMKYRTAAPGTDNYKTYLQLWIPKTPLPAFSMKIPIDSAMLEESDFTYTTETLETPRGTCGQFSQPQFASTRNILALQQCNMCHTGETDTNFNHISNRLRKGRAQLSPFLVGNTPKPTIRQLWYGLSDAFFPANVHFYAEQSPGVPCPAASTGADRNFHDLARRALFLSAVLKSPKQSQENVNIIQTFSTDFSH